MRANEHDYQRFVAALLEHGSIKRASQACGISYMTGRRWFQKPHVREALDDARRDAIRTAFARLNDALAQASDALVRNLGEDAPASVQVRAAQVLLDAVFSANDALDLDARISKLEQARDQPRRGLPPLPFADLEVKDLGLDGDDDE